MYSRQVLERFFTEAEEQKLFRHIKQFADLGARRDYAWMRFARSTGVRVSVLVGMTCADARAGLATEYFDVRGEVNKRGKAYRIYLAKAARSALHDLLAVRREQGHVELPHEPVIMSRNHRGLSERSFQSRMEKWVKEAGLSVQASPHWFRHTLGQRIIARSTARNPLVAVAEALGHDNINSTRIYTLPTREEMARTMEEAS